MIDFIDALMLAFSVLFFVIALWLLVSDLAKEAA